MSKIRKRLIRILISATLFVIMLLLNIFITNIPLFINLPIYLIIYLIIGYDILEKACRNVIYGKLLDENFLMTVATIGAFCIGEFSEGVAVMIFYQAGELFQSIAVRKSRKSVAGLMDLRPDFANKVENGMVTTLSPEEIQIGDIIEIKAGEKIALDCIVISGQSNIDTSMLTGESQPKFVKIGDSLISGCVNIDGTLQAKVTESYSNSTVNRILDLVQNAQEKKSKSENFITKFAKIYTPIVCILAIIIAFIPPIFVGNITSWIYRALCFLVVSCPCALVISVPLSFFAGIGSASRNGILIKGSSYIEKLPSIDTFVFDKTGTITKGIFEIKDIITKIDKNEILRLATIAECKSTHPIAQAIMDKNIKIDASKYAHQNIIGQGVIAYDNSNKILVGNETLMKANDITFEEIHSPNSIVHVAKNKTYMGAIIVGDTIKSEAKEVITELHNNNIKTIMLSGDGKEIVTDVADSIGINEKYSNLLPDEKLLKLEEILKDGNKVAFVGDGINDSPSLVRSDVGISMGSLGTDSAIEASDIVIMNDNLKSILKSQVIAKKTMRIVKENIFFAIGVKIVILILSALGLSNMWWAVFGDVGVTVIAILNAIRALKS